MRSRPIIWLLISLLLLAGGVYFWQSRSQSPTTTNPIPPVTAAPAVRPRPATTNHSIVSAAIAPAFLSGQPASAAAKTNRFAYRLTNTTKSVGQLLRDDHAILLENALIDTRQPLGFSIPQHLQAAADPGSYIVQAHGPVDDTFRAALTAAGGTIISYIPNNAYLVRLSAEGASRLSASSFAQAVSPYEPIYKLKAELLALALEQKPLPPGATLNVMVFADLRDQVIRELQLGGVAVLGESPSTFIGPILTLRPGENWTALAQMPGVAVMERVYPRVAANDLSRALIGVAAGSVATNNYLDLTGDGVLVSVNDTGVDAAHPDLTGRVLADFASGLVDDNGHGTFVAGEIAGSGAVSATVSNAAGSINPGELGQYRGKAPGAKIFSQSLELAIGPASDAYLQTSAARTNAFISNNSWHYGNNNTYGMASASYDAAVRDALPGVTGSQPVLFIFAAGNAGDGTDTGIGGDPGSIFAPGTAKNVITVGATELARDITNAVLIDCTTTNIDGTNVTVCQTNYPWQGLTSSDNEVAAFSSRGNVGRGIEGDFGRFKPDVVAPGTFVISTRSTTWDEQAYYNPTSHYVVAYEGQFIKTNSFYYGDVFLPDNAVGFSLRLLNMTNQGSGDRVAALPIFVQKDDYPVPPTFDFVRTNIVRVPPDGGGVGANVDQSWYYGVFNTTTQNVIFDIVHDVVITNLYGNQLEVLSNLNNSISSTNPVPPYYYVYGSGTSMAAADVSGTLALMQQFFQDRQITNSPAMMKALLINGARSAGPLYNLQVQNSINYQGWGLINLPNSLHSTLTNGVNPSATNSMLLFDQSPASALATGQSQTWKISVSEAGRALPLRVTLVWTDPPGNPAAGVKLVNDLDLVVTNLDGPLNPIVYYGNDFPANSLFTFASDTNAPPSVDVVNNVENVYITPSPLSLGTNYSITVSARRVNVNAVTAQTNNVVQDYALVISSGDGEAVATLTLSSASPPPNPAVPTAVTVVSNLFSAGTFTSGSLTEQRVGANTPLLGTTNGMTNQWHFYIVTNNTTFTNASFLISASTDLSIPRIGVYESTFLNATRKYADLDLYVSQDPGLIQLAPGVIAGANTSRSRNVLNGDEAVIYSDSIQGQVYYIGVKSEDQMAGEFEFFAVFSLAPLAQEDADGYVQAYPFNPPNGSIPDGSPDKPGVSKWIAYLAGQGEVRRVIVTNSLIAENIADLVGAVASPNQKTVVLNNHSFPPLPLPPGPYNFVYEDNDEGDVPGAIHPDGPGQLRDFVGDVTGGQWKFYYVDNSLSATGSVNNCKIKVERQPGNGVSITNTVPPNSWQYYAVNVPAGATNLTVCLALISAIPQPLELYVRKDQFPTTTNYDYTLTVNPPTGPPPGTCLSITRSDIPPLTPGRYFVGIFNGNPTSQTYVYTATYFVDASSVVPILGSSVGNQPLRDDAVTDSIITVTNDARIQQVEVGLRIAHPRVSDLAVTLISPRGTRVLLAQNRGGNSTAGFGTSTSVTNVIPVSTNGGPSAVTNIIDTGATAGSLTIDYDFFDVPDQMTVYYQGALLLNTGLIPGAGQFKLNYGPGASTLVTIIMNEFGNPSPTTAWNYTVSSINNNISYLVFTENPNLTTTPIKFAPPPLTALPSGPTVSISNFEPPQAPGDFGISPPLVDGWSVLTTNVVTVITGGPPETVGAQSLALQAGQMLRTVPTVPGRRYELGYAYRKAGSLDDIVAWWPGQLNAIDIVGGNNGTLQGGAGYAAGEVGQAFSFNGINSAVKVPASADLNVGSGNGFAIEGWINPFDVSLQRPIVEWNSTIGGNPYPHGAHFYISVAPPAGTGPGCLYANLEDTGGAFHYISSAPGLITPNVFQHVAVTYDKPSGLTVLYLNGIVVAQQNLGTFTPDTTMDLFLGHRPAPGIDWWVGIIDEMTIYRRVLKGAEIQAIYAAGAAGKCGMATPPSVCGTALGAQIFVPGQVTNTFLGTPSWRPGGLFFTAQGNSTTVGLAPVNPNDDSGVFLDSFTLTEMPSSRYVLAEDSLEALKGENANGDWKLELWDSRVGATNQVSLLSWELQFVFQDPTPLATAPFVITQPATNIAFTSASLNASVYPNGSAITVYFEYGITTNYGFFSTSTNLTGNLNLTQWLGIGVTNLTPATLYHFRAVATNILVALYGGDLTFTTPDGPPPPPRVAEPPFAATLPATLATGASAQLNGMATPNGAPATAWFEWGTSPSYGIVTPPVNVGSNFNVIFVTNQIAGLVTNLPYHFRLVVSNALGVAYGFDQIFDQANVVAWGATYFGQATVPPELTNLVTSIAAGYDTSLAVNSDGTVVVWGDNTFGQTNVPAGLNNAVAAAGGDRFSAALRSDRTVLVWGSNQFRQTNSPPDLTNAVALSSGGGHCLALRDDGNVVAWGFNGLGQTNVPTSLSNVVAIAAGELHSLALKNDGTVAAWGYNDDGATNVPPGLTNVVAIAAGYHNLALKEDGTVVSWGYNGTGQTNVPAGLSNIIAISAGSFHSLALKNDGTLVTWGDNSSLQTSVPPGLSNVVAIAGGGLHSLALSSLFGLNQTNTSPFWLTNPPSPIRMEEMTVLVVTNTASDTNLPAQTLSYSLLTGPIWASINAQGHITLSPQVGDGPSTNTIITRVVDNGYPALSATNQFEVIVGVPAPSTNVIISILYTNSAGTNGFLLTWFAPSNQLFQVQWTDSLAPVNWQTFPNPPVVSYNPNFPASLTNAQFNFFDDGSQTGGFGPTRSYRVIPVSARPPIVITDTTVTSTNFCLTWNSVPGVDYHVEGLTNLSSTNWVIASPTIPASGSSTTWCVPLPSPLQFFRVQEGPGVTNTPIVITDTAVTSTNFCLTWTSLPGVIYHVEGLTNLSSTNWVIASPTIPASGSSTTWCVPLPSPLQFFRVQEGPGVTSPPSVPPRIQSITYGTNGVTVRWNGPNTAQYNVQWTPNLAPPAWNSFTNLITSPTGLFQFLDDGSQTSGLGSARYYRLLRLP